MLLLYFAVRMRVFPEAAAAGYVAASPPTNYHQKRARERDCNKGNAFN